MLRVVISSEDTVKPIAAVPYKGSVMVIGDDGTAWRFHGGKKAWRPLPAIPGTPAAGTSEAPRRKRKSLMAGEKPEGAAGGK